MERRNERALGGPVLAGSVALLITGLLALVTLAAGGTRPVWHDGLAARPVPDSVQDTWITLLIVAYATVIVAALVAMFRRRDRWATPDSHWIRNTCIILASLTLVAAAGSWAVTHGHLQRPTLGLFAQRAQQGKGQGPASTATRSAPARAAHFQWPLLLAVGGLFLIGGVWIVIRNRRRPPHATPDVAGVEAELVRAIGSTIDELRQERDPRRAVIAAYANMERILASHGLARRGAEVPYEYLLRVLVLLNVRQSAVRELTELFEYAKFSDHEIDSAMKERAIESLVLVKEDLGAPGELAA
ncbi:MAG: hypothetical protein QOE13_1177 [Gaiellaceae bacterium]|nr:hypothetical protein [Gaiellaceae bacterium]